MARAHIPPHRTPLLIAIARPRATPGERPSTDVPVHVSQEDLSVSRHHASLVFAADGTLYLTDLDSAQARRTFSNLP